MRRIISTSKGLSVQETFNPSLGKNDVLIKTQSSFFSTGTESAVAKDAALSLVNKASKFNRQILNLLTNGDWKTLLTKINKHRNLEIPTGYSCFGRVLAKGADVNNFQIGQTVVAVGNRASHSSLVSVPKGLVFPVADNKDYCATAVLAIALNAVEVSNIKPFMKAAVIGAGLIGQLLLQLLKAASIEVHVVDKNPELREISRHSGCDFFGTTFNDLELENEFDFIFITAPVMDTKDWNATLLTLKVAGTVVMVGAADINIPRKIYYSKRLKVVTAFSYGSGRGEHKYEELGDKNVNFYSGRRVDELVNTAVTLIDRGTINLDFVLEVDMGNTDEHELVRKLDRKPVGIKFIWPEADGLNSDETHIKTVNLFPNCQLSNEYNGVDLIGHSAYFQYSHKPALDSLGIPVTNIANRTPINNIKTTGEATNSVLISTPNDEHMENIRSCDHYGFIFVDKPIATTLSDIRDYLAMSASGKQQIIALMSRRWSSYTKYFEDWISSSSGKIYLDATFSVDRLDHNHPIYFRGGRIIGEMCHHLDLAIHLLGPVQHHEWIVFDSNKETSRQEFYSVYLRHETGNISRISYTPFKMAGFEKEKISLSSSTACIENIDFRSLNSVGKTKKAIKITELDKGCKNMWKDLDGLLRAGSNEKLADYATIDRQVYSLLTTIFT